MPDYLDINEMIAQQNRERLRRNQEQMGQVPPLVGPPLPELADRVTRQNQRVLNQNRLGGPLNPAPVQAPAADNPLMQLGTVPSPQAVRSAGVFSRGSGPPLPPPYDPANSTFAQDMRRTNNVLLGDETPYGASYPGQTYRPMSGTYDPQTGFITRQPQPFGTGTTTMEPAPDHPYRQQFDYMRSLMDLARQNRVNPDVVIGSGFGSTLNRELGAGRLGLDTAREFGINGLQGDIANRAQEAGNRSQENARYGPEARYDAFYNQAYGAFPPGTPHAARVRQLQSQGMSPPQFLTGQGRQQNGPPMPGQSRRPIPDQDPAQLAIDTAFETGLSAFPRNPTTGARDLSQGNPHQAITSILESIPDAQLQANFPEIQRRLIEEIPGGIQALDAWINSPNTLSSFVGGRRQQSQIQRLMRMARMRQTPITPMSEGLTPTQRYMSANPVWLGASQLMRMFQ